MPRFWKQVQRAITGVDSTLPERGIRGQVEVLAVKDTNQFVGDAMVSELSLRVTVPGWDPYDAVHREAADAPVGTELPVFVDPQDPQNIFIDWHAGKEAIVREQLAQQMGQLGDNMPPDGATPREQLEWQLRKGYITKEVYDAILSNNPDL